MKYFILGMLFVEIAFPLIDGVLGCILTWLEAVKGKFSLQVARYNDQIQNIENENLIEHNVIGFSVPDTTNDDEEEYEDE